MTESEWLVSADPAAMLAHLRGSGTATTRDWSLVSDRKLRLFACACGRQVWPLLTDERSRRAVEVAERYADGLVTDDERERVYDDAIECSHEDAVQVDGMRAAYNACRSTTRPQQTHFTQDVIRCLSGIVLPATQAALLRCIAGNPWKPLKLIYKQSCTVCGKDANSPNSGKYCERGVDPWEKNSHKWQRVCRWFTPTVVAIAETIYRERDFAAMPVLADALEDNGCDDAAILDHCRGVESMPCPDTETVRTNENCPLCGRGGRWRNGVHFDNEKICWHGRQSNQITTAEPLTWEPGQCVEIPCRKCRGTGRITRPAVHARGCWVVDMLTRRKP